MSERVRAAVLGVSVASMVAAMVWWGRGVSEGAVGAVGVLGRPLGSEVVLSLLPVRSIDGPDRYVIGHSVLEIPVFGPTGALVVGQEVTVGGRVEAGGVRASWVQRAPARGAKKGLGLVGLLAGALLGAAAVRVEPGGLALRGARSGGRWPIW